MKESTKVVAITTKHKTKPNCANNHYSQQDKEASITAFCKESGLSRRSLSQDTLDFLQSDDYIGLSKDTERLRKKYSDKTIAMTEEEEIHTAHGFPDYFLSDDPHYLLLAVEESIERFKTEKAREEQMEKLSMAINALPPQQKIVMLFVFTHDVDGWKMSKIGRKLGISAKHIGIIYRKAFARLKVMMDYDF
jgi:hypothetical protein